MKRIVSAALLGLGWMLSGAVQADAKAVEEALKQNLPTLKPDSVQPSPIPGLYEVMMGAKLFYVSEDGRYLIQGSMVDVKDRKDLTEAKLAGARLTSLDKMGVGQMIVFKPKATKHVAYVFTDIDCGYCRKLHSEIDQYLAQGIEIRYLFFPRSGPNTESYFKAVSVWCAKDRNAAFTKAKKGDTPDRKDCDNPVDEQLALGNAFGANGTPMIITEKGDILPGYVPAAQLVKIMEQQAADQPEPQAAAKK
ncbi:thiol:disulfide interchange protein DsbC [Methylomagnum ishizawai]|uniref:Thiol:disulfide interchange protein n=1 Tax=Methylomagnum ishizawai TaxID=1760988 RepID=A0A1Y6DB84_9GAMM|nr:DsbC family protein [Methylomagnum ishizawai]SMF96895.1 thiol:disulfide interchange protein DsbC [Methylomagnum ishizawai]